MKNLNSKREDDSPRAHMKQEPVDQNNSNIQRNPEELLALLSPRSREKALWVLRNKRVAKYVFYPSGREIWIVSGEGGDYLVLGDYYCSCLDFYLESLVRIKRAFCYHIVAKKIAECTEIYRTYETPDSEFENLITDLMKQALDLL